MTAPKGNHTEQLITQNDRSALNPESDCKNATKALSQSLFVINNYRITHVLNLIPANRLVFPWAK